VVSPWRTGVKWDRERGVDPEGERGEEVAHTRRAKSRSKKQEKASRVSPIQDAPPG